MTDRLQQYNTVKFFGELETKTDMLSPSDKQLVLTAVNKEWTNPKFKLRYFVGQTQITPFAKLRQWLLEIRGREETLENLEYEIAKSDLSVRTHLRNADLAEDPLEKERFQMEAWKERRLKYMSQRRLQDWYLERQQLIDLVNEFNTSDEGTIKDGSGRKYMDILNTEEEDFYEAEYWTNRLGKQAACDMLFYGRIGVGNMDAILSLNEQQQTDILALAINYSSQLAKVQSRIQDQVDQQLVENIDVDTMPLVRPVLDFPDPRTDTVVPVVEKNQRGLLDVYNN